MSRVPGAAWIPGHRDVYLQVYLSCRVESIEKCRLLYWGLINAETVGNLALNEHI